MRKMAIGFLLILCLLTFVTYGQTDNSALIAKWHQDLQYLATELPRLHINAFSTISKTAFEKAVAALDSRLDALSDNEIVVGMSKIVALIGDAQTNLSLLQPQLQFHYFPVGLTWLKDGYYVTGTTTEHQTLLGAKLLKINGADIDGVIGEVSRLIPHENEFHVRENAPYYMVGAEILQALHIIPNTGETVFEFQFPNGAQLALPLKPVALTEKVDWQTAPDFARVPQPLYLKNPDSFYWYEVLPDTQDLYFQYNSCREIPQHSFTRFAKELLLYIDKHPDNRLIVDLRFNNGGNPALLEPFINELKKRPALNQRGHLFVIIGRKTFSAAVFNALKFKSETNALLVGEPTGGSPNHSGEIKSFVLPNSGLTVTYSPKFYSNAPTNMTSLIPDINAEPGAEAYFSGQDPALQAVMNFQNP